MKVLVINGSPRANQCTATALDEVMKTLQAEGVETELIHVGNKDIRGCIGCNYCRTHGKCMFNDIVNETAKKFEEADGIIIGSPVYFASPNGTLLSFLDRLFFSTPFSKHMKVGAAVVSCRHAGGGQHILEPGPRLYRRRCEKRSGRPADHAQPGPQHGLSYESHC